MDTAITEKECIFKYVVALHKGVRPKDVIPKLEKIVRDRGLIPPVELKAWELSPPLRSYILGTSTAESYGSLFLCRTRLALTPVSGQIAMPDQYREWITTPAKIPVELRPYIASVGPEPWMHI